MLPVPSCAGCLLPAASLVSGFLGWVWLCFLCKPLCAAPNARHPTKIRVISVREGKALLIPEHHAQTRGRASGNQCECFAKPKHALWYIFICLSLFNLFLPFFFGNSSICRVLFIPLCSDSSAGPHGIPAARAGDVASLSASCA